MCFARYEKSVKILCWYVKRHVRLNFTTKYGLMARRVTWKAKNLVNNKKENLYRYNILKLFEQA
jgi:hypothetical protein